MAKKTKRKSRAGAKAAARTKRNRQPLPSALVGLAHPPVSGRYYGPMISPDEGDHELNLRVDIDRSHPNSLIMNRLSGDIHAVFRLDSSEWRVYLESWIVDDPQVHWRESHVEVTGDVRSWNGSDSTQTMALRIPWTQTDIGPAYVTLTEGGKSSSYECEWRSNLFRDLEMEIDVCGSANVAPLLPKYETDSHEDRPEDLPRRRLTIEAAFAEAGIGIEINDDHTVIDDSAPEFEHFTPAELHDLMVNHFEGISRKPSWKMWGVMASKFVDSGVGGIMFDAAAEFGGAGVPPERQGFAVFRQHRWFANLVDSDPANQAQAAAARKFLYTWIHEAGHAWNFLHSWDKSRPDSLSWMNYDWRYDDRHDEGDFWKRFEFRFDEEELLHLRHGKRSAVIMGGDAWGADGHLRSGPSDLASIEIESGSPPLELLVRSSSKFGFLEPVEIEIRLRNLLRETAVQIDGRLDTETGAVAIYVKGPDGVVRQYKPLMCMLAEPQPITLRPASEDEQGPDRLSRDLPLTYGGHGFYFDKPGEYQVRAVYQGTGGMLIPSNVHRITIGFPTTSDQERMAQDFFDARVGLALYLNGSLSPRLTEGMQVLHRLASSCASERACARVAAIVADAVARPFFGVVKNKLKQVHKADPKHALEMTSSAVRVFAESADASLNLPHRRLAEQRYRCWEQMDEPEHASAELQALQTGLANRGVNPSVLQEVASIPKRGQSPRNRSLPKKKRNR